LTKVAAIVAVRNAKKLIPKSITTAAIATFEGRARDLRFSGPPAKKNSLQSGNFSRYSPGTADLLFPDVG